MKNQKKCRKGIYRLALLLTVLCSAVGGYAQTQDDLKLVDPGGFKLCNGDAVNGQKLTVTINVCMRASKKELLKQIGEMALLSKNGEPKRRWSMFIGNSKCLN